MSKTLSQLILEKTAFDGTHIENGDNAFRCAQREHARLRPFLRALSQLTEVMEGLKKYAENIEKKHPDKYFEGLGYSLLGQLAQQVSTEGYYAIEALRKLCAAFDERKVEL